MKDASKLADRRTSGGSGERGGRAALHAATRPFGLSPGARACIALAERMDKRATTAGRPWPQAPLPVAIELVR